MLKPFLFILIFIIVLISHIILFNNLYAGKINTSVNTNKPFLAKIIMIEETVKKKSVVESKITKVIKVQKNVEIKKSIVVNKSQINLKKKKKEIVKENIVEKKQNIEQKKINKFIDKNNGVIEKIVIDRKVAIETVAQKEKNDKVLEVQYLNNYIQYIKETILKNKFYPKMAKRMGIQGNCSIKLHILNTGIIKSVNMENKSDFTVLNKASLEIVHRIQKFKEFPSLLQQKEIVLIVPIKYRLEG